PTLRQPEPAERAAASSPPPPPRPEVKPPEPKPATTPPSPPPPPKPAATASAAPPPPPPAPAAKAPEPPKAPPPPALPTATAPESEKATPAKETQVAAATTGPSPSSPAPSPSSQGAAGDVVRVPFDANQSALPPAASAGLDAVVARLRKDSSLRVQLMAYADGDEDNANKARRLSLSRALAVRAYLIDKQIQSTRMDVRALGNRTKDSPKDRVDVVLVSR
ncbi:MAG: OmpA family protein, partial [Thalassobaculum sp.]